MDRRSFLRGISVALSGVFAFRRLPALAQAATRWSVRQVLPGDEDQLVDLMRACVRSDDAFHGLCHELGWTRTWAETVVGNRSRSIVITLDESIVAFFDLPTRKPRTFGEPTVDHYQKSFWCAAAGVRMDLLGEDVAVQVFRQLLYRAFAAAMELGYEFVRSAPPWEKHPHLSKPFTDYPGLTSTPFVDEQGNTKFLQEWRLADAMEALAEEGAGADLT